MEKEFIDNFFKIAVDEMHYGTDHERWLEIIHECFSNVQSEISKKEDVLKGEYGSSGEMKRYILSKKMDSI